MQFASGSATDPQNFSLWMKQTTNCLHFDSSTLPFVIFLRLQEMSDF